MVKALGRIVAATSATCALLAAAMAGEAGRILLTSHHTALPAQYTKSFYSGEGKDTA